MSNLKHRVYKDLTTPEEKDWLKVDSKGKWYVSPIEYTEDRNFWGLKSKTSKEGLYVNPDLFKAMSDDDVLAEIPFEKLKSVEKLYGKLTNMSVISPVRNLNWEFFRFLDCSIFTPAANAFKRSKANLKGSLEKPRYTHYLPGTKNFENFWDEEFRRWKFGYEPVIDGKPCGIRISGEFYFYLNYSLMTMPIQQENGTIINTETFPNFMAMDYYWFRELEARENPHYYGLDESYKKSISCTKTRRAGFSYKEAAGCCWIILTENKARVAIASAPGVDKTDAALAAKKCFPILDHITNFTPFGISDLGDPKYNGGWKNEVHQDTSTLVEIRLGYFNTKTKEKAGRQSSIVTIALSKDDAAAGEGLRRVYFEEAGKIGNLAKAWTFTLQSLKAGNLLRGIGIVFGCVCAGTKVYNNRKELVNIEDIKKTDGIYGFDGDNVVAQDLLHVNPPYKKPCYRITTIGNNYIECSEDHPFLSKVNRNSKTCSYVQAKDLSIGEYLSSPSETPLFGEYNNPHARIIGLLIGDGYYGSASYGVSLSCSEVDIKTFLESNYDVSPQSNRSFITKDGKDYDYFSIRGFKKHLINAGIYGQSKDKKTLPKNIDSYDKESLANLLGGFFDADGNVKDRGNSAGIVLTQVYLPILEHVKFMLLKFGIQSSITKEYRTEGRAKLSAGQKDYIYRLYITDNESALKWRDNIGFLNKEKQGLLADLVSEVDTKRTCKKAHNLTYKTVEKSDQDHKNLDGLKFNGILNFKITKIEFIGEQNVYNVTAAGNHNYLANNFLTHNTGGSMLSSSGKDGTSRAFSTMHYNPDAAEIASFKNIYEYKDMPNARSGYFVSSLWCHFGSYIYIDGKRYEGVDANGNSYFWVTELALNKERKEKMPPKDTTKNYNDYLTQKPITASEAFLITQGSIFQTADLIARQNAIRTSTNGFEGLRTAGELEMINGRVNFIPDLANKLTPITTMNEDFSNKEGCLLLYEKPQLIHNQVPSDAYIITVDPIGQDTTTGKSFSSIQVIKSPFYYDAFGPRPIVATYFGRHSEQPLNNLHDLLLKLSKFYNAKITYETDNSGGQILPFFTQKQELTRLLSTPDRTMASNMIGKGSKTSARKYGHTMGHDVHKSTGERLLYEWLGSVVPMKGVVLDANGVEIPEADLKVRIIDLLEDEMLIEQLIVYNRQGNYDAVLSLMGGIVQMKEIFSFEPVVRDDDPSDISSQLLTYYGKKVSGQKQTGGRSYGTQQVDSKVVEGRNYIGSGSSSTLDNNGIIMPKQTGQRPHWLNAVIDSEDEFQA